MSHLSSNFQEELRGKRRKKERRLFHAKDFQSLMNPCFTFCRFLGIFPYKINDAIFKASKLYYIVSIVVICVCSIVTLIVVYVLLTFENVSQNMIVLPAILEFNCISIFGNFIIVVTFILNGPRIRLLQTILKISSRLPSKSYEKLSRLIHAKDIIGFCYLFGIILKCVYELNILFAIQMYISLAVFEMDMLYMNCVCILKACFKRINDDLANMKRIIVNDVSPISRLNYHDQRNQFLIMELKALKKQHLVLTDTIRMLNMIFSLQLLATIIMIFSEITFCLYYYILFCKYFFLMSPVPTEKLIEIAFILHIAFNFIKMALIVWACETGKNQALQISISIHDLFNIITDEQLKDELQLFSLQTLHCNNTFGAKGLVVDAKLLTGIVGSIVTYELLLFQFMFLCEGKMANNITKI